MQGELSYDHLWLRGKERGQGFAPFGLLGRMQAVWRLKQRVDAPLSNLL